QVALLAGEGGGDEERAGDGAIGAAGGRLGERTGGGARGGVAIAAGVVQARGVGERGGELGVATAPLGGGRRREEERERAIGLAAHLRDLGGDEEVVERGPLGDGGHRVAEPDRGAGGVTPCRGPHPGRRGVGDHQRGGGAGGLGDAQRFDVGG